MTQFITVYPHYWGQGDTPEKSKKEARKVGGRGNNWVTKELPEGAVEPWVDDFGAIRWLWGSCEIADKYKKTGPMELKVVAHGRGYRGRTD